MDPAVSHIIRALSRIDFAISIVCRSAELGACQGGGRSAFRTGTKREKIVPLILFCGRSLYRSGSQAERVFRVSTDPSGKCFPVWVTRVFFCAVMLSSWFGGLLPGFFAGLLSAVALDYFFIPRSTLWELA
jgi:hypothetical protein